MMSCKASCSLPTFVFPSNPIYLHHPVKSTLTSVGSGYQWTQMADEWWKTWGNRMPEPEHNFDVSVSVHCKYSCEWWPTRCNYFWLIYLFLIRSTCFGQCLRPTSGALDCIYSFWYSPTMLLPAGVMDGMELHATESHSAEHATHKEWHKRTVTFEMHSGSERMHTWRRTPSTGRNFQTLIIWITVSYKASCNGSISVNFFFLGFLQFLLGFSKVLFFCIILY